MEKGWFAAFRSNRIGRRITLRRGKLPAMAGTNRQVLTEVRLPPHCFTSRTMRWTRSSVPPNARYFLYVTSARVVSRMWNS